MALFGTAVLVGSRWSDFHELRTASAEDGGSSSGGGDSGGCGGGRCGGEGAAAAEAEVARSSSQNLMETRFRRRWRERDLIGEGWMQSERRRVAGSREGTIARVTVRAFRGKPVSCARL